METKLDPIVIEPCALSTRYLPGIIKAADVVEQTTCPVCTSTRLVLVSRLLNRDGTAIIKRALCDECDHQFFSSAPSRPWFEQFYANQWDTTKTPPKTIPSFNYGPISDIILPFIDTPHPNILDLGCGYGSALKHFHSLGYERLFGIEPSQHRVNTARSLGFPIIQGSAEALNMDSFGGARMDVMFSWHAFEHMTDPAKVISNAADLLNDGGLLFIAVPNVDAEHTLMQAHFLAHIHSFSMTSLATLFRRGGFELLYIDDSIRAVGRKLGQTQIETNVSDPHRIDRTRRKFVRDFDMRRVRETSGPAVFSFSRYNGNREILEPSYGRLEPTGRRRIADGLAEYAFGLYGTRHGRISRLFQHRLRSPAGEYRLWGRVHFSKEAAEVSNPRVDIVYGDDGVIAWVK